MPSLTPDRTPTVERLEFLVRSLDEAVNDIYNNTQIANLGEEEMISVLKYMGNNFSQRRTLPTGRPLYEPMERFGASGETVFYDIGYNLLKDQIKKELGIPEEEKRLLFDGIMGWLWYNPGTSHDWMMNLRLQEYAGEYGAEKLSEHFVAIRDRFNELGKMASMAEMKVGRRSDSTIQDKAYLTMFRQLFSDYRESPLDLRQRKIAELVPGFNPE